MRSILCLLLVGLVGALPSGSRAAVARVPPTAETTRAAATPAADDAVAAEYEEALEALRAGRWGEGQRLLDRYLARGAVPRRAEAELLRDLARQLAISVEAGLPPGALDQRGRAELAVFSTLYGLWAGGLVTYLGDLDRVDTLLLMSTLLGGTGLAISMGATKGREITEGRARLISMGGTWGTVNAAAWGLQAGLTQKPLVTTMLVTGVAGIVAGATVFDEAPAPGYLSLVNSAGLWSAYAAGMLLLIAQSDASGEDNFALVVAGADLGLGVTALLADDVQISQGRVRLIDLGGLLGTLGAAAILSATTPDSESTVGALLLGGTTVGLLAAALATTDWDDPPGGELRSGLDWRGPAPALLPAPDGEGVALGASLVSGRF